jgi:hypothetical protein
MKTTRANPVEQVPDPFGRRAWALAQRVAASRHFSKALQLQHFLLFVCEKALLEGAKDIPEHEIGHRVLGRREDYDPNQDNIVRVQARHLRRKLEEYFETEGATEPLIITIPKGSYLPRFEARPVPGSESEPQLVKTPTARRDWLRTGTLVAVLALIASASLSLWLWLENSKLRSGSGVSSEASAPSNPLWDRVFAPGSPVNIVLADINLVSLQMILGVDVGLEDYLSPDYPARYLESINSPELRKAFDYLAFRQFTALADANLGVRLSRLADRRGAKPAVRYARHLHIRDLKGGNVVFLGSRSGIPWVTLYEKHLNFRLERMKQGGYYIRNLNPRPGELALTETSSRADLTYASIALLPGLDNAGVAMILNGIDMVAAEAAGELVSSEGFARDVLAHLGQPQNSKSMPFFEVLIRVLATGGAASRSEIVGSRLIQQ